MADYPWDDDAPESEEVSNRPQYRRETLPFIIGPNIHWFHAACGGRLVDTGQFADPDEPQWECQKCRQVGTPDREWEENDDTNPTTIEFNGELINVCCLIVSRAEFIKQFGEFALKLRKRGFKPARLNEEGELEMDDEDDTDIPIQ